jgi:hypothetical protein
MPRGKRGPQTAAGKKNASRNALRHGLTAVTHRPAFQPTEVKNFADALCDGEKADPNSMAAALEVAEREMALRAVRAQMLAVVERLRETTAIALQKGDNGLIIGRAKFLGMWILEREIDSLVPRLMEKYKDQMLPPLKGKEKVEVERESQYDETTIAKSDFDSSVSLEDLEGWVPYRLKALLNSVDSAEEQKRALDLAEQEMEERDEHEALEEAMLDLLRLTRYERQAWCRLLRAMRKFANAKLMLEYRPLN